LGRDFDDEYTFLSNLCKNGGAITIKSKKPEDNWIETKIIDEGIGMSKERLSKLGEPFYTGKEKGTGLGLMVSMRIVKEYGEELNW
jgi:signal transduction histidine kinase